MRKFLYILGIAGIIIIASIGIKRILADKIDISRANFVSSEDNLNLKRVRIGNLWALVDNDNYPISDFEFEMIKPFNEKRAVAQKSGKFGYISNNANKLTDFKYDVAFEFVGNVAYVMKNGKWGMINLKGKELIAPVYYDYISPFDFNGVAMVENYDDGYKAIINKSGNIVRVISPKKVEIKNEIKAKSDAKQMRVSKKDSKSKK